MAGDPVEPAAAPEAKAGPSLVPTIYCRDLPSQVAWLQDTLGFAVVERYPDPQGRLTFAKVAWGDALIWVSGPPPADNPWASAGAASIALVAQDAAAVERLYQRAQAAGANFLRPLHTARSPAFTHGIRQFDLADPAGNLWTVSE